VTIAGANKIETLYDLSYIYADRYFRDTETYHRYLVNMTFSHRPVNNNNQHLSESASEKRTIFMNIKN